MVSRQEIKKLYDSFEIKDMSFEDFYLEFIGQVAPVSTKELMNIQLEKAIKDSAMIQANREQSKIMLN